MRYFSTLSVRPSKRAVAVIVTVQRPDAGLLSRTDSWGPALGAFVAETEGAPRST